jgi:ATP-dependent RNA helicase RhlE
LVKAGITAQAIHGNKSQSQRDRVLTAFRRGEVRTLVATDIAARGIDVDGISHVVNFDLPNIPETYVHRIGRTARAGADGIAISLCDAEERAYLRDIEKLIGQSIPATDRRQHASRNTSRDERPPTQGQAEQRSRHSSPKRNGRHRNNAPRPHNPQGQARETADGIGSVAFLRRGTEQRRKGAQHAQRAAGSGEFKPAHRV